MKRETIILTPKNYMDYPPSMLIRSFLADIDLMQERSKKSGKTCTMSSFSDTDGCLGCLGGHAALAWSGETYISNDLLERNFIFQRVAFIGDDIRKGAFWIAMQRLKILFPNKSQEISYVIETGRKFLTDYKGSVFGEVRDQDYKRLKNLVNTFADFLEENDL